MFCVLFGYVEHAPPCACVLVFCGTKIEREIEIECGDGGVVVEFFFVYNYFKR